MWQPAAGRIWSGGATASSARSKRSSVAVWLVLAGTIIACGSSSVEERRRAEARQLEARLMAPCCWMQTVDVHESPIAHALRDEIEARVSRGEAIDVIERDLVDRHGGRIRVTPPGAELSLLLYLAGGFALLAGALVARRWVGRGRGRASAAPVAAPATDRRLEDLLDDELDRMD